MLKIFLLSQAFKLVCKILLNSDSKIFKFETGFSFKLFVLTGKFWTKLFATCEFTTGELWLLKFELIFAFWLEHVIKDCSFKFVWLWNELAIEKTDLLEVLVFWLFEIKFWLFKFWLIEFKFWLFEFKFEISFVLFTGVLLRFKTETLTSLAESSGLSDLNSRFLNSDSIIDARLAALSKLM